MMIKAFMGLEEQMSITFTHLNNGLKKKKIKCNTYLLKKIIAQLKI